MSHLWRWGSLRGHFLTEHRTSHHYEESNEAFERYESQNNLIYGRDIERHEGLATRIYNTYARL
jgi:hypothetical protein